MATIVKASALPVVDLQPGDTTLIFREGKPYQTPTNSGEEAPELPGPATPSADGLMAAADKAKLDGVQAGATANDSDAALRNRGTHTGTQAMSTVSGLPEALSNKVDKVAGKGLSTNDYTTGEKTKLAGIEAGAQANPVPVDNLTTPDATKPLSANQGRVIKGLIDAINVLLQSDDSTLDQLQEIVDFVKLNRAELDSLSISSIAGLETALANRQPLSAVLTATTAAFTTALQTKLNGIAAGATVNATDAQLRARSSHTGTQAISTVDGLRAELDARITASDTGLGLASSVLAAATGFDFNASYPSGTSRMVRIADAVNVPAIFGSQSYVYAFVPAVRDNRETSGASRGPMIVLGGHGAPKERVWIRTGADSASYSWFELLHTANFDPASKLDASAYTAADVLAKLLTVDGSASGLDADLLDGLHASSFLRSNATTIFDDGNAALRLLGSGGKLYLQAGKHGATASADRGAVELGGWFGSKALGIRLYADAIQLDGDAVTVNGNVVHHAGNFNPATKLDASAYTASDALAKVKTVDGAGSGLDADLLDGKQLSEIEAAYRAYADAAAAALISQAPATLDTLYELAAALGNDPNFAATIAARIGEKLDAALYTAADVLAKLLTVDGAGSKIDADLLDGQHGDYYRNAGNLNAGTVPDARLPARLGARAQDITDWNGATSNGWYMSSTAANAPQASVWFIGHVENHGAAGWCTQTVHAFTADAEGDTRSFRREQNNGTWGAWYRLRLSEAEQRASPEFTGTPKAPTAAPGTNTMQIATTAYVQQAISTLGSAIPAWQSTIATLTKNTYHRIDFSAPRMLTLPASPAENDFVEIYVNGGEPQGSTVARNGATIMGLAEDLTLDGAFLFIKFVYSGSTWRILH